MNVFRLTGLMVIWMASYSYLKAQTEEEVRLWASELMESLAADQEDMPDMSELLDEMIRLYQSPLNINTASREELEQIFFLSDLQIEELLFRRYQLGFFISIYDLQVVKALDRQLIQQLEPLIVFDEFEAEFLPRFRARGDLFLRSQWTLETPRGYVSREDGTTPFQGNKLKLYSRLEIEPLHQFKMGLVTEKDPGEPMFNDQIPTMDFVSGYLSWKPDGFLKEVVLGQYRMSAGQGLALQTGMPPRKSSMTTSVRNRHATYRPSLSVVESGGLNGVMMAFGNRDWMVIPFASVQKIDGRLDEDDAGNRFITSIKTDGYHRTLTELNQRKTTLEEIYGVQMKYFAGRFIIEAGHLEYRLEYPLQPVERPYNRHYFTGKKNRNSWLAAEGSWMNVHLFGEAAFNANTEPAIWAGVLLPLSGQMNMVTAYRRIPLEYKAPLGAPLTEASHSSGESGLYTGLEMALPAGFTLATYLDYFEHAWLGFQTKAPSRGADFLSVLTFQPFRGWDNTLRFRYRRKAVNQIARSPDFPVGKRIQRQWRLQTRYVPTSVWRFTTRCDFHFVKKPEEDSLPYGFYLAQDIQYRDPGGRWNLIARYAMMDVEEYDARIYAYEPDVLYSFSTPAYYGRGSRWIVMAKYTIIPRLDVWVRFSRWYYSNRESISSGHMMIDGNVSREVRFQIRKKF